MENVENAIKAEFNYENEVTWTFRNGRKFIVVNLNLADNQSFDSAKGQAIKQLVQETFVGELDEISVNVVDAGSE